MRKTQDSPLFFPKIGIVVASTCVRLRIAKEPESNADQQSIIVDAGNVRTQCS